MIERTSPLGERLYTACEKALEAGIFYQDEFKTFVLDLLGGYDCELFKHEEDIVFDSLNHYRDSWNKRKAFVERIQSAPRGHYLLIVRPSGDGTIGYEPLIADGFGELGSTGGRCYETPPAESELLSQMIGYEIYTFRRKVERDRLTKRNIASITKHNISVNHSYKNIRLSGSVTPYSTAVVETVDNECGMVTLLLTKRGSRNRWRSTIAASDIAKHLECTVDSQNTDKLL